MILCRALLLLAIALLTATHAQGSLLVGTGESSLTPPAGTPSAGYAARHGGGMEGVHDPLIAAAMLIDNGTQPIAFCSVDHLGFTYEMTEQLRVKLADHPLLGRTALFIGATHTHSGGGAYLDMPVVGPMLAGPYNKDTADFYIDAAAEALTAAAASLQPALLAIGYGQAEGLAVFRSTWPADGEALDDLTVIKATALDGTPLAVLFNFAMHPTVLDGNNRQFSADFVGYARDEIRNTLGHSVKALYFNGAQAEIVPAVGEGQRTFEECARIGRALGRAVLHVWEEAEASDTLAVETRTAAYSFTPLATPQGLRLPLDAYDSEISVLVFGGAHAFAAIPGELSSSYGRQLKAGAGGFGFEHVSVLGLVNDAHGYILTPEAWRHRTAESALSFGGEEYGERVMGIVLNLIQNNG